MGMLIDFVFCFSTQRKTDISLENKENLSSNVSINFENISTNIKEHEEYQYLNLIGNIIDHGKCIITVKNSSSLPNFRNHF